VVEKNLAELQAVVAPQNAAWRPAKDFEHSSLDEDFARIRVHRNGVDRYRRLLGSVRRVKRRLCDLEPRTLPWPVARPFLPILKKDQAYLKSCAEGPLRPLKGLLA